MEVQKTEPCNLCVIGTLHRGHVLQPRFPLALLHHLLDLYAPDLVLLEIRAAQLAAGHWEDAPFEMAYLAHHAEDRGIAIAAFDWWQEPETPNTSPELDTAPAEVLSEIAELERSELYPPFEVVHAPGSDTRLLRLLNARARRPSGDFHWAQRQAWMNHAATQAIEERRAKRCMLFAGYYHRMELEHYLSRVLHATVTSPLSLPIRWPEVDPCAQAPAQVIARWRQSAARLRERSAISGGVQGKALARQARQLEHIAEHGGACTLALDELP